MRFEWRNANFFKQSVSSSTSFSSHWASRAVNEMSRDESKIEIATTRDRSCNDVLRANNDRTLFVDRWATCKDVSKYRECANDDRNSAHNERINDVDQIVLRLLVLFWECFMITYRCCQSHHHQQTSQRRAQKQSQKRSQKRQKQQTKQKLQNRHRSRAKSLSRNSKTKQNRSTRQHRTKRKNQRNQRERQNEQRRRRDERRRRSQDSARQNENAIEKFVMSLINCSYKWMSSIFDLSSRASKWNHQSDSRHVKRETMLIMTTIKLQLMIRTKRISKQNSEASDTRRQKVTSQINWFFAWWSLTLDIVSNIIVSNSKTCIVALENATFEHQENKHDEKITYENNDVDEKKKKLKECEIWYL